MAPVPTKKRGSEESITSAKKRAASNDLCSPSTPQRSAMKKRKTGISSQQKQALIENLRLEITERARRLRAQYHLQAQGLRSRVEIRINRIPTALRKLKMGDLLLKYMDQEQQRAPTRPPPIPAKDPSRLSPLRQTHQPGRVQPPGHAQKRLSNEISGDKENSIENGENHKKRARGLDAGPVRPTQILSPTSSNSRVANRERTTSPIKPQVARPPSPMKASGAARSTATNVLSSMVEKAKATRAAGARKMTTTSNSSSSSSSTSAPTRSRRTTAAAAPKPPSRPPTRTTRRASGNSETSEGSTNTVVRKTAASKSAMTTKKSMINSIKKGVAGVGAKSSAAKNAASAPTNPSGRVLRKRG